VVAPVAATDTVLDLAAEPVLAVILMVKLPLPVRFAGENPSNDIHVALAGRVTVHCLLEVTNTNIVAAPDAGLHEFAEMERVAAFLGTGASSSCLLGLVSQQVIYSVTS